MLVASVTEGLSVANGIIRIITWLAVIAASVAIIFRIVLYFKVARRQRDVIIRLLGGGENSTSKALSTWREPDTRAASSASRTATAAASQATRSISIRKV